MKRFRLDPLIVVRQRRMDAALAQIGRCRQAVAERERARAQAERRLDDTVAERVRTQLQALATAEVAYLHRAEQRLAMLAERAERERAQLRSAEEALAQAQEVLQLAIAEYRRLRRKYDAIVEQKQAWHGAERRAEYRSEELATEELVIGRYRR